MQPHAPNSPVISWATDFIDSRISLEQNSRTLDVGCRNGVITQHLANRHPQHHICAVDTNTSLIEQTSGISKQSESISFDQIDLTDLKFDSQFDHITSFSYLHWIQDKSSLLKKMYAALRPGGKIYLQFFADHGQAKNDRFLFQTANQAAWRNYFNRFTAEYDAVNPGYFYQLLRSIGFIVQRLETKKHPYPFEHPDQLMQWLGTWASHTKRIPTKKQATFLAQSTTAYLKAHQLNPQQAFTYYEYILEVECEKPTHATHTLQNKLPCFTQKETQVLTRYLEGKHPKEIALLFGVSVKTIEFHIANIKKKLGCHKRSDVFQMAWEMGFINLAFQTAT